jgi:hypothetical protein
MERDNKIRKVFHWTSIILYIISMTQVGYYDNHGDGNGMVGIVLLLLGWMLIFSGGTGIVWLANPILWYSWAVRSNLKNSFWSSFAAFLIALVFLTGVVTDGSTSIHMDLPTTSYDTKIIKYGLGYRLWLLSTAVWFIGNFYLLLSSKSE